MDPQRFPPGNGGRPHHQQQQLQPQLTSRRTIGGLRTTGTLHSQPKAIPALLKSSKADFGEDYIDSQRRNRFGRNGGARARSEIAEVLSNGGNSRLNTSFYQHRRETSYNNDDDRHSLKAVRSTSYYDRPRSSFEPSRMNHSTSSAAVPRLSNS
uniref:Uncharacterized protein n=1 Tax=Panagrolaimus davidi TaxID=227884 RepID=A0A914Q5U9_9BILA